MLAIDVAAFALLVGTVGSAFTHTLVDTDSEPGQGFVDIVLGAGHKALRVGILDAEYHVAAMLAGKEIIVKGGADSAYMKRACGRRREAHSNSTFSHIYLIFRCLDLRTPNDTDLGLRQITINSIFRRQS